jgi:hypothetical protein
VVATTPTLAEYTTWVNTSMGIPTSALPTDSQTISDSYNFAKTVVNPNLALAGGTVYTLAVYNYAGHFLVMWAPDQPDQFYPSPPADPPSTPSDPTMNMGYFYWLRSPEGFDLNSFLPGVIRASNDVSTGQSLVVPKQFETLSVQDLAMTRTPWGQMYLQLAQMAGTDWGIS